MNLNRRRGRKRMLADMTSYKKEFDILRQEVQESGLPEDRSTLTRLCDESKSIRRDLNYVAVSTVDETRVREISELIWGYDGAVEKLDELWELADKTDFDSLAKRVELLDRLKGEATGVAELKADIGFDADQELSNTLAQARERCSNLWELDRPRLFKEIAKGYWRCGEILEFLERANCFQDIRSEDWNAAIVKRADKDTIRSKLFRGITTETMRDTAAVLLYAVKGNITLAFYLWLKATEDHDRVSLDTSTLTDLTRIVGRERSDLVPHPYPSDLRQSD